MAIRYDKEFNAEIRRVVANFNQKIMRLSNMERVLAPDTVKVSDLKKEYNKRSDLKRRLRELQLFSKRGMEKEIEVGYWNTNRYNYELKRRQAIVAKRNLTREYNQEMKKPRLQNTTYVMNLQKRRQFLNKPIRSLNQKQLKTYFKTVEYESDRRKKDQMFYDNMYKMVYRVAYRSDVPPEVMERLLGELRQLSPAEFADMMRSSKAFALFDLQYDNIDSAKEEALADMAKSLEYLADDMSRQRKLYEEE